MASVSWPGVGVNHSFWNVSFTSFCSNKSHLLLDIFIKQQKQMKAGVNSDLDSLFVVDPPDHFDTHFGDLAKAWLFQANIPQDLYDPLSHTNTCVLYKKD